MKLVLLFLNNFLDSKSHLLHEIGIKLRIEVVSLVLVEALNSLRVLLMEMLFDYANDGFLHFLLHDMILSRCIDFIEELLLTLFKSLSPLLLRVLSIALLFLELLLELIVIFFGKGFNSKSYLLLEIISGILRERPSHKLLNWDHILRKWLRLGCNCGGHWI